MQYLLTPEEYQELKSRISVKTYEQALTKIGTLNKKILELTGFKCIHEHNGGFGYCDFCPLSKLETCMLPKQHSK